MAMPFRVRPLPNQPVFHVNSDPAKLDAVYNKMLGKEGDAMLPEEVKWLAVTHKSFDHGRRGSNDRLAFLGMFVRWVVLVGSCRARAGSGRILASGEHSRLTYIEQASG